MDPILDKLTALAQSWGGNVLKLSEGEFNKVAGFTESIPHPRSQDPDRYSRSGFLPCPVHE